MYILEGVQKENEANVAEQFTARLSIYLIKISL